MWHEWRMEWSIIRVRNMEMFWSNIFTDKVYVFGGYLNQSGAVLTSVEYYDVASPIHKWTMMNTTLSHYAGLASYAAF